MRAILALFFVLSTSHAFASPGEESNTGVENLHTLCVVHNNSQACVVRIGEKYLFTDRRGDEHIFTKCGFVKGTPTIQRYECTSRYEGGAVPDQIGYINRAYFTHVMFEGEWHLIDYGFM